MLKCKVCAGYTLKDTCGCGGEAIKPLPPKYRPDDKYASYRRRVKFKSLKEMNLL